MNCVICDRAGATGEVWAYAHRKGAEVAYPVCVKCESHPKHSAAIVDGINRKLDRENGYR